MCGPLTGVRVLVDEATLQVHGIDAVAAAIKHYRHLEQEYLVRRVHLPCDVIGGRVEDVAVAEKAAGEAAEDQDSIAVLLNDAAALAFWQDLVVDGDHLPRVARLVVVALNRVDVLAALVGDTAEDVNPAVTHRARRVIVSANVEVGHLKPEIDVGVVHLTLHM